MAFEPGAILALIHDIYTQLTAVQMQLAQVTAERDQLAAQLAELNGVEKQPASGSNFTGD